MRKLRYAIYDTRHRCWLLRVEMPTGDADHVVTLWKKAAAEALRFPGVKSAAARLRKLGEGRELIVVNGGGFPVAPEG